MSRSITRAFALTLCAAAGAAAQPIFTPRQFLPGDAVIGSGAGAQNNPAITRGGSQYLVAWQDQSSALGGEQTDLDVFGMRLDLNGQPLDVTPFIIAGGFGYQRNPRVAWNGQDWLVTFDAQVPTQFYYQTAVQGVRVSPQGAVLDAQPITLLEQGSNGQASLATLGANWVVVGEAYDAGIGGLKARRLGPGGQVLDAAPVTLVPETYFLYSFGIATTAGELLVGWTPSSGGSSYVAQRFDSALNAVGAQFPIPSLNIASNGTGYYLTWYDANATNYVGSPMTSTGALASGHGFVLGPTYQTYGPPRVAFGGTRWWVSWTQINQGVRVARVDQAGTVLDPGGVLFDIQSPYPTAQPLTAASATDDLQMVWSTYGPAGTTASQDMYGMKIGATLVAGAKTTPSVAQPHQLRPDLVAGPSQFLAVFTSEDSTTRRVLAQRLDTHGAAIDLEPIEIAAGATIGTARACFDGTRYMIAYSDNGAVFAKRLAPSGTLLDVAPIAVMTGFSPDVAARGGEFLVVGSKFGFTIQVINIVAQRVDAASGALVGSQFLVGGFYAQVPKVIALGSRWLATWQNNYSHDNPQADTQAAFVESNGSVSPVFTVSINAHSPDVAATANEVLFVYRTNSLANANNDIAARRMLPDGTFPAASFIVTNAAQKQFWPAVTHDGSQFLLAWEDRRNAVAFYDYRTDVYGARVSNAGVLLDPASYAIDSDAVGEARPALASVGGSTLYASSVFRPDPGITAWRVATRATGDCLGAVAAYGDGCPGSGGFVPVFAGQGCPTSGSTLTLQLDGAFGGAPAFLFLGATPANLPLLGCSLLVFPVLPTMPSVVLAGVGPGQGHATLPIAIPTGIGSGTIRLQWFIADVGGVSASNGLTVEVN